MGWTQATGIAEAVNAGSLSIDQALTCHLQHNHFPPVSRVFIPACIEAIQCGSSGEWAQEIDLPNGRTLTASEIVEGLHLEAFLEEGTE